MTPSHFRTYSKDPGQSENMQFVEIAAIIALTLLSSLLMQMIKNDSEYNQLIQDYRLALSEIQNLTQFLQNRINAAPKAY